VAAWRWSARSKRFRTGIERAIALGGLWRHDSSTYLNLRGKFSD